MRGTFRLRVPEYEHFSALWKDLTLTRSQVASELGVSETSLAKIAQIHGLSNNRTGINFSGRDYIPTPEEIRSECQKIQEAWSDEERQRRSGMRNSVQLICMRF